MIYENNHSLHLKTTVYTKNLEHQCLLAASINGKKTPVTNWIPNSLDNGLLYQHN